MPTVRQSFLHAIQDQFCEGTIVWSPEEECASLSTYLVKNGVFHLFIQEYKEEARKRILDLYFMAAFISSWDTPFAPLAVYRIIGLQSIRKGFAQKCSSFSSMSNTSVEEGLAVGI